MAIDAMSLPPGVLAPPQDVPPAVLTPPVDPARRVVAPSDLCTEHRFRFWLGRISHQMPGAMAKGGGTEAIVNRFKEIAPSEDCASAPEEPRWPRTSHRHGPILNVGEGTTGTRFLDCVFSKLDFRTSHNEHVPAGWSATDFIDQFDYVSDEPLAFAFPRYFATHENHVRDETPGVLLSLRDPMQWARSRWQHHVIQGAANWKATPKCLGAQPPLKYVNGERSQERNLCRSIMLYNAFAACMATSPRYGFNNQSILLFNLFNENKTDTEIDLELAHKLSEFLRGPARHVAKRMGKDPNEHFAEPRVQAAIQTCALSNAAGRAQRFQHSKWSTWAET